MNFITSSTVLLRHLQSISGVLSTSNTLPILDNFLFEINDNENILLKHVKCIPSVQTYCCVFNYIYVLYDFIQNNSVNKWIYLVLEFYLVKWFGAKLGCCGAFLSCVNQRNMHLSKL